MTALLDDTSKTPSSRDADDEMLSRQLPRLTQRLQTTLDKLQNPAVSTTAKTMRARDWWKDTNQRHGSGDVVFQADGDMEALLPAALFDTVLENCLENARKKRDDVAQVTITLHAGTSPTLAIADNGAPIPATAMAELFHAPIARSRHGGLGIGLYQAHKQAEQMGYALTVAANLPGRVEFLLAKVESENGG